METIDQISKELKIMSTIGNPILSFCSTCMNRGDSLKKTLPHNKNIINRYNGLVELVLVNFIKDDEGLKLHDWILQQKNCDFLNYRVCKEMSFWNSPKAKNTSHISARGSYLINLDCDNFLSINTIDKLLEFEKKKRLKKYVFCGYRGRIKKKFKPWRRKNFRTTFKFLSGEHLHDGSYGNIGLSRDLFILLGGYNETLPPMGGEDVDLFKRAACIKKKIIHIPSNLAPIANDKEEGLMNTINPKANWEEWNQLSEEITKASLLNNELTCNVNKPIGLDTSNIEF